MDPAIFLDPEIDKNNQTFISQIANLLVNRRIGFLFGAGMSIPSGGLRGPELAFKLIKKALYPGERLPNKSLDEKIEKVASKYPLQAIAEGMVPMLPQQETELAEILKAEVFRGKKPDPHEGHKFLTMIVNKLNLKMVFTTNWDSLLEEGMGDSAESITEKDIFKLENVLQKKTAIIHLHGTFDQQPLIKESDLIKDDQPLYQLFLGELITKSFVFVGYSLNDLALMNLYYKARILLKQRHDLRKATYIIFPCWSKTEWEVASQVWKGRWANYIALGAEDFFQKLYNELVSIEFDEFKKELAERIGISLTELDKKISEIQDIFPDFGTKEQVLNFISEITQGGRK